MASTASDKKHDAFRVETTDERGQIAGLEPHAQYILLRRPTREVTMERSRELMDSFRAFLQAQRETTERQIRELNDKYAPQARAKVAEVRETVERRVDAITREIEARVEKLETIRKGPSGETPGEMPRGDAASDADKARRRGA